MKKGLTVIVILVVVVAFAAIGCKKSKKLTAKCDGSHPTYNNEMKPIIDKNCTTSACHPHGSPYGDFTTYIGIQPYLNSGTFKSDVIDKQIMPKDHNLTQDEINKIECWVEDGYLEK